MIQQLGHFSTLEKKNLNFLGLIVKPIRKTTLFNLK